MLDAFLKEAQQTNLHIQYTIWPNFICNLKVHKFYYNHTLDNIHCGITPFALQCLTETQTAALIDLKEATAQASNIGIQDILCHNCSAPWHVSPNPHMFLELLATFSAITNILFSPWSP